VETRFDARFSRFYFAADIFADPPLRVESDQRGLRMLSVLRFERHLQRPQLVSIHFDSIVV
jgi:hypothetical protein